MKPILNKWQLGFSIKIASWISQKSVPFLLKTFWLELYFLKLIERPHEGNIIQKHQFKGVYLSRYFNLMKDIQITYKTFYFNGFQKIRIYFPIRIRIIF